MRANKVLFSLLFLSSLCVFVMGKPTETVKEVKKEVEHHTEHAKQHVEHAVNSATGGHSHAAVPHVGSSTPGGGYTGFVHKTADLNTHITDTSYNAIRENNRASGDFFQSITPGPLKGVVATSNQWTDAGLSKAQGLTKGGINMSRNIFSGQMFNGGGGGGGLFGINKPGNANHGVSQVQAHVTGSHTEHKTPVQTSISLAK